MCSGIFGHYVGRIVDKPKHFMKSYCTVVPYLYSKT